MRGKREAGSALSAGRIKWGFNFVAASGLDKCIPIVHAVQREERRSRAEPVAEVREEGGRTSGRGRGPACLAAAAPPHVRTTPPAIYSARTISFAEREGRWGEEERTYGVLEGEKKCVYKMGSSMA